MSEEIPWHEPGKWYGVPSYWEEEVQSQISSKDRKVKFIDTTLNEGEDMVGKHLSWNEWVDIAKALDDLGVDAITDGKMRNRSSDPIGKRHFKILRDWYEKMAEEIEADIHHKYISYFPWNKDDDGSGGRFVPLNEVSGWQEQIDRRFELGADSYLIGVGLPKNDIWDDFGEDSMTSIDQIIPEIKVFTEYAVEKLNEKAPEADLVFAVTRTFDFKIDTLQECCAAATEAGADGIYIFDSQGRSTPLATRFICEKLKETIGNRDLYIQHHNDLGMATACSVAAAEGGADYLDVSMCGVGDRGGTAALEEVACALAVHGWETNIDLGKLNRVAETVNDAFDLEFAPHKPIIGSQISMEEGEGHRDPGDPAYSSLGIGGEVLNRPFEHVVGWNVFSQRMGASDSSQDKSERFIKDILDHWGYGYSDDDLKEIRYRAVDQIHARDVLSLNEFRNLVRGVLKS